MTSRQPPSQRNRSSIDHAVRHNSRGLLSQGGPGFLSGRFATAQPVPGGSWVDLVDDGSDDGPETDDIQFEHAEPAYSPTDSEMAAGIFTRQLLHTEIAAEHGLFTTINGVAIGSKWWSLDAEAGVVTVLIPDWLASAPSGSRKFGWPMYAYRSDLYISPPPIPIPVPVSYVAAATAANGPTSIAFPAGVQVGDIAIAVAFGRIAGNPRISDARFNIFTDPATSLPYYTMAATNRIVIGTWVLDTDTPTAAGIIAPDLGGVQDGVGMLYVVRPSSPVVPLSDLTDSGDQVVSGTFSIPGFAEASAGVAILCTIGGIGGAYGWGLSGSDVAVTPSSYGLIYTSLMDYRPVVPAATASPGIGSSARGFMVGLGLA